MSRKMSRRGSTWFGIRMIGIVRLAALAASPGPRRLLAILIVCLATTGAIFGCSRASDGPEVRLTITGSSTLAPLVAELARDYEQAHPGVRIDVQSGGSSRGILDVGKGLAALGMISRDLGEEEQDIQVHPIARDGVGLIVHARNPVPDLSRAQVAAIYRGEIRSWRELGAEEIGDLDGEAGIVVVHKAEGRATRAVFLEYLALEGREVEADVIVGENEQAIKTVAGSPNAIGYVSIGTAAIDIAAGVPIRLLAIDGVEPSLESLRSGRYPIARSLNLVSVGPLSERARDFVAFIRSPAARPRFEAQRFLQVVP
jgi:phosphate transport system substrate-binding protein